MRNLHTVFHGGCISLHSRQPMYEVSLFSTYSPTPVFCCLFDNNHSDRCRVLSLWFWFDYPCWLNTISVSVAQKSVCLPWKNVYSGPLLNFNWIICFFNIELFEFLKSIVWILILCWLYQLQYLSHSVGVLFILLMVSFIVQKHSSLM